MSELDNCNNCRRECNRECKRDNMGEGMVPFVVYGYPMRMPGVCPMPLGGMGMGMNMMDDRCQAYGCMPQCFPQMNVMNPMFSTPYTKPNCSAVDLDE